MTPDSIAEARRLLAAPAAQAFSCDIFDTALLRRCTRPDGVYARAFQLVPIPADRRFLEEAFVQHRQIAEGRARQARERREGFSEVGIDAIYAEFPVRLFGLTAADRPALAAAEFQAEQQLCRANPEVFALLAAARQRGLAVGFVSDTYWSSAQLAELLAGAAPELRPDFLYSSCEHGIGKAAGLFPQILRRQGWASGQLVHLGDNPQADHQAPAQLGIAAVWYPQQDDAFAEVLRGEDVAARLLRAEYGRFDPRCDGGRRILRRQVAGRLPPGGSPWRRLGATVVGPLFAAFHRFTLARLAEIRAGAPRPALGFIARDGFLPSLIWEAEGEAAQPMLRLNRHIAVLASAEDFGDLAELLREIPMMDLAAVENFLRLPLPQAAPQFQTRPHGVMPGHEVLRHLPQWLSVEQLRSLARTARQKLLDHLRHSVPGFDQLSDLVLVDLGYYGNIQKYLRKILDLAGLPLRLHGLYLATVDQSFAHLAEGDSVVGFFDDTLVGPTAKVGLLRNIPVIEQFCSEPVGSVGDYLDGVAQTLPDGRAPEQLRRCAEVRQGCLDFLALARQVTGESGEDPWAETAEGAAGNRAWALVLLARLLLLPTPGERALLQDCSQDVNLGSAMQISMLAPAETANAWNSLSFLDLCQIREPPAWLSGGLTALQPAAGFAYAMVAFGVVAGDLFAEQGVARLQATLILDGDRQTAVPASLQSTAFGEWRLRVPVLGQHGGALLALPLEGPLRCGLVRGCLLQGGDSMGQALANRIVTPLPRHQLQTVNALRDGNYVRATAAGAHLLVPLPRFAERLAVLTLSFLSDDGEE